MAIRYTWACVNDLYRVFSSFEVTDARVVSSQTTYTMTRILRSHCIFFSLLVAAPALGQDDSQRGIKGYFSAVVVKSAEESSVWYQSVLGLNVMNRNENVERGSKIIVLASKDILIELIEVRSVVSPQQVLAGKPNQTLMVGFTKIGFKVPDLDLVIQRLRGLKVEFYGNIYSDPLSKQRSFLVQDPDKNLVQFFE
jgi:hypothetical protein